MSGLIRYELNFRIIYIQVYSYKYEGLVVIRKQSGARSWEGVVMLQKRGELWIPVAANLV